MARKKKGTQPNSHFGPRPPNSTKPSPCLPSPCTAAYPSTCTSLSSDATAPGSSAASYKIPLLLSVNPSPISSLPAATLFCNRAALLRMLVSRPVIAGQKLPSPCCASLSPALHPRRCSTLLGELRVLPNISQAALRFSCRATGVEGRPLFAGLRRRQNSGVYGLPE
jgi:hypothetical protein